MNTSCLLVYSEFNYDNAGSHRQVRWANEFLNKFSSIYVIFPTGFLSYKIIRFSNKDDINFYVDENRSNGKLKKTTHNGKFSNILRFIKYALFIEFFLPVNFIIAYAIYFLLKKNTEIKVVSVSSPPFPLVLFSVLVLKFYSNDIKLHLDMRDPWALHHTLGGAKFIKRWLEEVCIVYADYLTVATKSMSIDFFNSYKKNSTTIYNVATHISNNNLQDHFYDSNPVDQLTIAYIGTMPEGFYDIKKLAKWISNYPSSENLCQDINWIFVGECERLQEQILMNSLNCEWIEFTGRISHKSAIEYMKKSDAVLFLGHKFPGYLTTKLFEYFAARKRILPLFLCNSSEAFHLIYELCGKCPTINSYQDFNNALRSIEDLPYLRSNDKLNGYRKMYSIVVNEIYISVK